jgi:hypothetical protein
MRERRLVGCESQRVSTAWGAARSAMRRWPVVGPDGRRVPTAGRRATTLAMRGGPVVGSDGKCMPAAGCRAATAGMRQRLVVGSDRQRMPSTTGTTGRLDIAASLRRPGEDRRHVRVSSRDAWGSALSILGRLPLGGSNITAVRPPCPQGSNIDRLSGLVIGGWCGVPGVFVVHAFVSCLFVDATVHYPPEHTLRV